MGESEIKRIEKAVEIIEALYEMQKRILKQKRENLLRHQYDFENN